jgi:hypothetical protein
MCGVMTDVLVKVFKCGSCGGSRVGLRLKAGADDGWKSCHAMDGVRGPSHVM